MNYPIMFIDGENKTKLVPASIPYFLNSYERKISFSLKRVIVLISLNWDAKFNKLL